MTDYDLVRQALKRLVEAKEMNDRLKKLDGMGHGTDYTDYYRLKNEAWHLARTALSVTPEAEEEEPETEPVLHDDGTVACFMVKDPDGNPFRCECGANVLHKPDRTDLTLYECNGCGVRLHGSKA